jgi:hypothetical protein
MPPETCRTHGSLSSSLIVPFTNDAGHMIGIAVIMRDATTRFEELRAPRRQLAVHSAAAGQESGA